MIVKIPATPGGYIEDETIPVSNMQLEAR